MTQRHGARKHAVHRARRATAQHLGALVFLIVSVLAVGAALLLIMLPRPAHAVVAVRWQLPFSPWNIDPRFDFGTPYGGEVHLGEDVERPAGTAVTSIAAGTVKATLNIAGYHSWGGLILIEHEDLDGTLYTSLYGHLDPRHFSVRPGQAVALGQQIGIVGTYDVNGNWNEHLHLAIRRGGYVSNSWVYFGFGTTSMLSQQWIKPSTFVQARAGRTDVGRVPAASHDRYETAVGVSAWRFPGNQSASEVLLASGEDWVGALAAEPLALQRTAPLLLSHRTSLPTSTLKELRRVLVAGGRVTVIGDTGQIGQGVADQLTALGYSLQRIEGGNPGQLSETIATLLPQPQTAFVVSDATYADAVSAGTVAATTRSPILLTDPTVLNDDVSRYLTYGVHNVVIVGGTAAVSANVATALAQLGLNVDRIAGVDRYDTSQLVAGRYMPVPTTVVLATGQHFADSLTGGTLAAQLGGALVLTEQSRIPASVDGYIRAVAFPANLGLILGGSAAVGPVPELDFAKLLNGLAG